MACSLETRQWLLRRMGAWVFVSWHMQPGSWVRLRKMHGMEREHVEARLWEEMKKVAKRLEEMLEKKAQELKQTAEREASWPAY